MDNAHFWFQTQDGGGPVDPGDPIGKSLRFRGGQRLTRSGMSRPAGNYTLSVWVKCAWTKSIDNNSIFGNSTSVRGFKICNPNGASANKLACRDGTSLNVFDTGSELKDPSAWYHLVFQTVGTNTTAFVNGIQHGNPVNTFGATGDAVFGSGNAGNMDEAFYGYMADVYCIDGQVLEPTDFGRYNADGVWVPVAPTGLTYGTNGFYLDFADPNDLGKDISGNDNHFTAIGFDTSPPGIFSDNCAGYVQPFNPNSTEQSYEMDGPAGLFDGSPSTNCRAPGAGFININFNPALTGVTKLRLDIGYHEQILINGTVVVDNGADNLSANSWVDLTAFIPANGEITQLAYGDAVTSTSSARASAIEVNDTILVDSTGTDYDLMDDSPTQNWATLNPLAISNPAEGKQYEKANLGLIAPNLPMFASTIAMPNGTGIYYWELQNQTATGGIGVCSVNSRLRDFDIADENTLITDNGTVVLNGTINSNAWNNAAFGGGLNQVYGCQYNSNTRRVRFYLNGEQPTFTSVVPVGDNEFDVPEEWGDVYAIGSAAAASGFVNINYGQQPFLHQPAGTVALQTQNMPAANLPDEITGTFTGNNSDDGPFVYTGCIPGRIQYGSVDVTYDQRLGQTDVDFLSNGFKLRSTNSNSGTVNYTVTTTHSGGEYDGFKVPFNSPAPAVSN